MSTSQIIRQKLENSFSNAVVDVIDESHQHAGHAGARPGGQTHYAVRIVSDAFSGVSKVQRHKLVYKALEIELKNGVHALRIEALAPGE